MKAHSYTLQVDRPYIALNSEIYITIRQQEQRTCKRIGYEFYCEVFFMLKHKSKYSCESTIYFDLDSDIIKEDITPIVLDGGNEIILANWPNDKHIICSINNNIPIRISSHLYALVNRSVLCNCGIGAEDHFLLESLAVCHESNSKLVMHFTVNTAFVNYLDQFKNLTEYLELLILMNKTTLKQTLPISLNISKFDSELLFAHRNLKNFIHQYKCKKEIFVLKKKRHYTIDITTNKNFLSNNYIVDVVSVCYCSNLTIGYNFGNISIMQTQET